MLSRSSRAAVFALALLAGAWPATVDANPFTALRAIAKAGSVAKAAPKAASAAKAAKGASGAGSAAKGLVGGGAILAAERAALVFRLVPDDAARVAAYVAQDSNGAYRLVLRGGEQTTHVADDLGGALGRVATEARPNVDVYLDLTAARSPGQLPARAANQRWFVLDGDGAPHAIRTVKNDKGTFDHVVDVGGDAIDLADFASAGLEEEEASDTGPLPFALGLAGLGVVVGGVLFVRRRRRRLAA